MHPLTIQVLAEAGIDTSGLVSKSLDEFMGKRRVQRAVIVCEHVEPECPRIYPFALETLHWPFGDPVSLASGEEKPVDVFRRTRDAIDARIAAWLASTQVRSTRE